jgi:hypothetical protein
VGFVLITLDGHDVRVVGPVEPRLEPAVEPSLEDAVLERVDLAHGRIALRLADGRFLARHTAHPEVGAQADGPDRSGVARLSLVDEVTPCAAFEEVAAPDGTVSLRGCDSRFLGVLTDFTVVAGRVANGSWERFRYREAASRPATPALPPQTGAVPGVLPLAVR